MWPCRLPTSIAVGAVIRIRCGCKGYQHRRVLLSTPLVVLREYWLSGIAETLALPRPDSGPALDSKVRVARVRPGWPQRRAGQARHRSHSEAQLRYPSPGRRHEHSNHPAFAWTSQPQDDGCLYPCLGGISSGHTKPARSARASDGRTAKAMTRPQFEVAEVLRQQDGDASTHGRRARLSNAAPSRTSPSVGPRRWVAQRRGLRSMWHQHSRNRAATDRPGMPAYLCGNRDGRKGS